MNTTLQSLPLARFVLSQTSLQKARRADRTKDDIKEMADSIIAAGGIIEPVIARPHKGDKIEMVAGEGRYLGAELAGLTEIPTIVRELTDEQVEVIQLIENLRRKGLHELVEAEGYNTLLKRGYTVDEVVAKTGASSKAYVYARLKLLALCDEARKGFREGKITASVALLVSRVPGGEQQLRALKHVTEPHWHGDPMSYRDAAKFVHDTFMLKLSDAPFPREDATLVASAGACGPCPMRTGNSPDLFGDVKGADVCTNPECFRAKKAAHIKRELEKAKATGDQVIRGGEAKRILPDTRGHYYSSNGSHKHLRNGYARPSDKCLDDPKQRTYAELAGKDAPRVLLQNPDSGRVEKVFKVDAIADRLKAKGIKPTPPAKDRAEAREQDQERRKQEEELEMSVRRAIFQKIVDAAPKQITRETVIALLGIAFSYGYGEDENIYAALLWSKPSKTGDGVKQFMNRLDDVPDSKLAQIALAMTVASTITDTYGKATELEALAKRLGVDVKKIRAAAAAAPAKKIEKPAPAKASKKKAAKKSKK